MVNYFRSTVFALCGLFVVSSTQEDLLRSGRPGNASYDYVGMLNVLRIVELSTLLRDIEL